LWLATVAAHPPKTVRAGTANGWNGVARDAFRAAREELAAVIGGSVSGAELFERGFAEDVALAVELGVSTTAPRLCDGAYRAAP
jgi:phosphosulfolactate phosphohydrolase-like enzyme